MTTINAKQLVNINPDIIPIGERPQANYVSGGVIPPPISCGGATNYIDIKVELLEENRDYIVSAIIGDPTSRDVDGTYLLLGFVELHTEGGVVSTQVLDLDERLDYEQLDFSDNQLTFRLSGLSDQDFRLYISGGTAYGDGNIPHHRISVLEGSTPCVVWDIQEQDAHAFYCCLSPSEIL